MAYGARLESVLGASPRGFESPILRHRTPGPVEVPGFLLPVAPLVFRAPSGPATVCAAGRRPAREPSAPRASLGASSRSPARPRRPRGGLQSGGLSRYFPSLSQASTPHAIQNSPSTRTSPISQAYFRAVAARVLSAQRSSWESPACDATTPYRTVNRTLSSR